MRLEGLVGFGYETQYNLNKNPSMDDHQYNKVGK